MSTKHPTRAAIESIQLEQLRSLLAELFPANKFYTRKLTDVGVTFDVASLEDFSARFPFTTKSELVEDQLRHAPFGTNLTYPLNRYTRFHQTSGTTGAPLRWLDTPESWDWMLESWMKIFREAGVRADDRVYFAFSFGPFLGFWTAFESAARLGCLCIPGGGLSSAARLRAMLDNNATVLCCTPTYALRMAEVARQEKIDLSAGSVKRIIVAGEPGGSVPATKARLHSLWPGAQVFDHHGLTETGPVSYECPARPGVLHVIETAYYAEVIDPANGRPVSRGSAGELVLTTLGRVGSPLLRYRTGDLVKPDFNSPTPDPTQEGNCNPACKCGRHDLALEGGILGRVDDMIIVRGVNIYPAAVEEIVRSSRGVVEYRACVSNNGQMTELRIEIETATDCADSRAVAVRLEKRFYDALSLRVPVTVVAPGALPRFEMKAHRWVKD
ncbi:MAG TPA: AMP-binding protein [Verrucomicrobiota bacterium]|nr:AMP-binding protein [Verrucomicrobiota bacterium]